MNNRPNCYICTDNFSVSGVTTQAYYLARGMVQQGWNVHIICYTSDGSYFPAFEQLPIQIHQIDTLSRDDFQKLYTFQTQDTIDISQKIFSYFQQKSIFNQQSPGIIVLNYMLSMFFILDKIPANIGRIFILHSDENFYYELLKHFFQHFDGIISGSTHINQQAENFLKSINSDVPNAVIPYGIDIPDKIPNHQLKIIYCGRLSEYQKRIFDTLEIANLLKKWEINFHLTLVGDRSHRDVLKLRISHLNLQDHVSIIGPLTGEQLIEQYQLHHIFLQVSEFEGLSIALLQAMANGLIPVVSKVSSGVTDIITDGVNGYLVEKGDINNFAAIIRDLGSSFQKLHHLRTHAVTALVNKGCTAEKMVYSYASFFDRTLSFNDLNCQIRIKQTINQNFSLAKISPQAGKKIQKCQIDNLQKSEESIISISQIPYIKENPTVTFFLDSLCVGGVQTFVKHMLLNLYKYGWNARLAIYSDHQNNPEILQLEQQGVQIITFSYNDNLQHIPFGLSSHFTEHSIGIIVPNYISQIYQAQNLAKVNLPKIHIFHADEPFYYEMFKENIHKLKAAIAVSEVCYQKAKDILNEASQSLPLVRIPYGVQMNSIWHEKAIMGTLKIIYSGRIIEHQKCIFEIPELAALAKQKGISCQWTLVGDGDDTDLLLQRIHSLGVDDCVSLVGKAPANMISDLLNQNHVFVLTSEFEGLSLSLLEAMGHGCVPIVYNIPSGIHEVIKHEQNGFIIPFGKRMTFVDALIQLADNLDIYKQMSYYAWNTVYPAYSVSNMVSKYANFFQEIIDVNNDNQ